MPGDQVLELTTGARAKSHYGQPARRRPTGGRGDHHVTMLRLQAMAPGAHEVSLAAADQGEFQRGRVSRIRRQRLERAVYAAERARLAILEFPGTADPQSR